MKDNLHPIISKICSDFYQLVEEELLAYCNHLGYTTVEEAHTSLQKGILSWEYWATKQVLLNSGESQLVIYKPEITVDKNKWVGHTDAVEYKVLYWRLYEEVI